MQVTNVQQPTIVSVPPRMTMRISAIRGLGITQTVIGSLTLIGGILSVATMRTMWLQNTGGGIWGGIWILVTGILGIASASQPTNGCLNGTHMAFCIISSIIAFIDGIIFAIGVGFYNTCSFNNGYYYNYVYKQMDQRLYRYGCYNEADLGQALFAPLLVLMIVEFFVAIVAAVYCCQATSSCCGTSGMQGGMIIQQQQQPGYTIMTSSTGQQMMVQAPPVSTQAVVYPGQPQQPPAYYPQTTMAMQPQMQPQVQPMAMQPQVQPMAQQYVPGQQTNVSYSAEQPLDVKSAHPP